MPGEGKKPQSMFGDIKQSSNSGGICSDPQKVLKWSLIIGVPSVLLIIVIIVVVVVLQSN